MRVLALGAHPDDIEIYMFGALAAWSGSGASVHFGVATDGSKGGQGEPAELAGTRRREAAAAAALLGADLHFLGFPDGELVPDGLLVGALKTLIGSVLPDVVLTHAPNDYHGDHRALSEAVRIASSFTAPVLHADTMHGVGFAPTYYVDVTAHFQLKARAIRAHVSQEPERFVTGMSQLNALRAGQCNAPEGSFAEAFRFEPFFPFADIRGLLPPPPAVRPVHRHNVPWK